MIYIEDEFGNRKDIIVDKPVQNGEDIQLTIDAELQKSCMNSLRMIRVVLLL